MCRQLTQQAQDGFIQPPQLSSPITLFPPHPFVYPLFYTSQCYFLASLIIYVFVTEIVLRTLFLIRCENALMLFVTTNMHVHGAISPFR